MDRTLPRRTQREAPLARHGVPVSAFALLALPLLVFGVLRSSSFDATVGSSTGHFYIVTIVAALALALAIAVAFAARRVPDPRTLFLALAFMSMAAIFFAHGAGTAPFLASDPPEACDAYAAYAGRCDEPGPIASARGGDHEAHVAPVMVVGYSARLSMFVAAVFFALATVDWRRFVAEQVVRRWTPLLCLFTALFAAHVYVALAHPRILQAVPFESAAFSWGIGIATWGALGLAGWRFLQAYRLAIQPLQGAMALAMGLLAEAQLFMIVGTVWRLSWWEYHAVMLAGFLLPVFALLRQYRIAGDLGAIVEGLFLRQQIHGIRKGDPDALSTLAAAVSAKDDETGDHIERVADLAVAVGERLGLPQDRLVVLRWAGRLHDVGKIGVPNSLLRKPGKLTTQEFAEIQRHSIRGHAIASSSPVLLEAAPIIRAHHERIDGSGYPDGLRGDAIPLEARIVSVCDIWDAVTSERGYKPAMSNSAAAAELRRITGTHVDARCVEALFAVVGVSDEKSGAA